MTRKNILFDVTLKSVPDWHIEYKTTPNNFNLIEHEKAFVRNYIFYPNI